MRHRILKLKILKISKKLIILYSKSVTYYNFLKISVLRFCISITKIIKNISFIFSKLLSNKFYYIEVSNL